MTNRDFVVLLLFAVTIFFVGWYFGRRYSHLEFTQQFANATISAHEKRIRSMEEDFERRQKRRAKLKAAFDWCRDKFGI